MNIDLDAKKLKGRPNAWRVTMKVPTPTGVETITTRLDAKDEDTAKALAFESFMRSISRRGKSAEARMGVKPAPSDGK